MSGKLAHVGSMISHGGVVVQGSPNWTTGANKQAVARQGDKVICAVHGAQTIVRGSPKYNINGQPAAYVGCLISCTAVITTSSSNWTVD